MCGELGTEDRGTLIERDTYFEVPRGRLKLREEPDAVAHLIAYERLDLPDQKESRCRLIEVSEPAELRDGRSVNLAVNARDAMPESGHEMGSRGICP